MDHIINFIFGIPTVLAQTSATEKAGSSSVDVVGFVLGNLPLWITAIVVFALSMVLGVILKNIVESSIANKITDEHQEFLIISGRLTFVGVVLVGGMIALAIAGINVTNLIAAMGFGISFGLQDTIANFVAGIALLGSRPFTIGDWISVDGKMGKVTEIRIRATYLNTYDGLRLIVPNSQLYKTQVLSYTSNPMRRMKVPAYTRYCIDMKQAFSIIMNVVKSHTDILLEPKPTIIVTEMGDYYVGLEVRFWVDSKSLWRRIQSSVFMEIQSKFEVAGIDSPYPTNALTFDTDDDQVFVKTQALDNEQVKKIVKQRMESEEQFTKQREALTKPHFMSVDEMKNLDQSGATFLKVTNMPLPATSQQQTQTQAQPVAPALFPPNSPQGMLQNISLQQNQQQSYQAPVQQEQEQQSPIPNEMPANESQTSQPAPTEPTAQQSAPVEQTQPPVQNNQQ